MRTWLLGVLVLAAVGCGGSSDSVVIRLESPAVRASGEIVPQVSCGQGTLWLPMKWGEVPEGTGELAIYIGQYEEAGNGRTGKVTVPFGALIDEVDPSLRANAANTLPEGSEYAYFRPGESCPQPRGGERILLGLLAMGEEEAAPSSLSEDFVIGLTEEGLGRDGSGPGAGFVEGALGADWVTATYGPRANSSDRG